MTGGAGAAAAARAMSALRRGDDAGRDGMRAVMGRVLAGETSEQENADLLEALAQKGETDGELLGMLEKMQEFAVRVDLAQAGGGGGEGGNGTGPIDMCGTGGDGMQTFNVSTAASFVVAAAGGSVAKHGNRSSSGVSGSADVFEQLGCDLDAGPGRVAELLGRHGICFMFAPRFHPAMMHVAPARRRLGGMRTAFNLLGPLSNPAMVKRQMVGVSSVDLLKRIPVLLGQRGGQDGGGGGRIRSVMAVRSDNGMDEFSTAAPNRVAVLSDGGAGRVETYTVDPEEVGLHASSPADIRVQTRDEAMGMFVGAVGGTAGRAAVETAALNAAGGLVVAGLADGWADAVEAAMSAIRDGRAYKKLEGFARDAGDVSRLREIAEEGAGCA